MIPIPSLEDFPLPLPDSLSTGIRTGLICNVFRSQPNFLASICFQFLKQSEIRHARGSATGGLPALGRTPSSGANRSSSKKLTFALGLLFGSGVMQKKFSKIFTKENFSNLDSYLLKEVREKIRSKMSFVTKNHYGDLTEPALNEHL